LNQHKLTIHLANGQTVEEILLGDQLDVADVVEKALTSKGWCWVGDVYLHPGSVNAIEFDEYRKEDA
jgi:hypothetical protein